MKNFQHLNWLVFVVCGLVLLGCTPEAVSPPVETVVEVPEDLHISLDQVIMYLPEPYRQSGGFAVYVDSAGNEKRLEIVYQDTIRERTDYTHTYTHDFFYVSLLDFDDLGGLRLGVTGTANLTDSLAPQTSIVAWLMPHIPAHAFALGIVFAEDTPVATPFSLFEAVVELNGKTYYDVFFSGTNPTLTAYSELGFNHTAGIVFYYDGDNHLWTFDRFE